MLSTQERLDTLVRENEKKLVDTLFTTPYRADLTAFIEAHYDNATVIDIPDEPNKKILLRKNEYPSKGDKKQFHAVVSVNTCFMNINSSLEDVDKREVPLTYENAPYETPRLKYRYINMEFTIPETQNKYDNLIINHIGGHHIYIDEPHEFQVTTDFDWRGGEFHYLFGFDYKRVNFAIDIQQDKIKYLTYYIVELKYPDRQSYIYKYL